MLEVQKLVHHYALLCFAHSTLTSNFSRDAEGILFESFYTENINYCGS